MTNETSLTVSQLNMYIKMMFEGDNRLQKICVTGEISNFVNHYKTGHCYFSLKDNNSSIKAVMFAGSAKFLKFTPENGMKVYVTGRISVFERDGVYQIYADSMEPEGAGALMIAFEQLKNKLAAQGLFDDSRKKPIPRFPQRIGVITSPVGAAVKDVMNVLARRYPLAEMVFIPVAAQGVNCAVENIKAIELMNKQSNIDVIILCRGGGSVEDLWGYNDEQLVRTVAGSRIPVITGIGHEIDFTLCDFASDMRAPTPSAAAEIAVPDIRDLFQITDGLVMRLENSINAYFGFRADACENIKNRLKVIDPIAVLQKREDDFKYIENRFEMAVCTYFERRNANLAVLTEKLKLLNPVLIFANGFAAASVNGVRIKSVNNLSPGDDVSLQFADGIANCRVENISKDMI